MTKWHWVPLLGLILIVIPCDTGIVLPDLGVLVESFERLTRRPSPWPPHLGLYLEMIAAVAVVPRRSLQGRSNQR